MSDVAPEAPSVTLVLDAPWFAPPDVRAACAEFAGERVFVTSAVGWRDGVWHDGPLVHVLPGGRVASYVPSGGHAALTLPWPPRENAGASWDEALATEGTDAQRAVRCLTAALKTAVDTSAHGRGQTFHILLQDFTPRSAVALLLFRKSQPQARVTLSTDYHQLAPPWRRFTQNAAIAVARSDDAHPLPCDVVPLPLVPLLVDELNALSEILPRSLVRGP